VSTLKCLRGRSDACTGLFLRFRTSPLAAIMILEVESEREQVRVTDEAYVDRWSVRCAPQRLYGGTITTEW
jgi:hypothetical protein